MSPPELCVTEEKVARVLLEQQAELQRTVRRLQDLEEELAEVRQEGDDLLTTMEYPFRGRGGWECGGRKVSATQLSPLTVAPACGESWRNCRSGTGSWRRLWGGRRRPCPLLRE